MKTIKQFLLIIGFCVLSTSAVSQVVDDFSDGDFSSNPTWIGMTDSFQVSTGQLRTKAGETTSLYLATAQNTLATSWEFYFRMAYNPSSLNYMEFWLSADNANLSAAQNGYYIRLGGNPGDGIGLYRKVNGISNELIQQSSNSLLNNSSNNMGNIKVTRTPSGNWEIFEKITTNQYISFGVASDAAVSNCSFIGLLVKSTTTNRGRHYLDDVIIQTGTGSVGSYRSVVINEIMADQFGSPTTVPKAEWIELYNPSTNDIVLNGWSIRDASTSVIIPTTTILAGGYLILTRPDSIHLFSGISSIVPLLLPTLNNTGDSLVLKDQNGFSIDIVKYSDSWYRDPVKDDGGYSLEQINPKVKCTIASNWIGAGTPSGGSPGAQNTVYSAIFDDSPPVLQSISPGSSDDVLNLNFSEAVEPNFCSSVSLYSIQPQVPPINIISASIIPFSSTVVLNLDANLNSSTSYIITVNETKDLFCNVQSMVQSIIIVGNKTLLSSSGLNLYPNPASETIMLQTGGPIISLTLSDALGRVEFPQVQNNILNISNLKPGLYWIFVGTIDGMWGQKFIKE